MSGIGFLYTIFGFIIYAIIGVYFFSGINEKQSVDFQESKIWIVGGIPFLVVLVFIAANPILNIFIFYGFLVFSTFLYLMILNNTIKNQSIVPKSLYIWVELFVVLWLAISIVQQKPFYLTVFPVILIQALTLFFIGLMYLLHEEYEMSMRNISGMLFLVLTILKVSYLFEIGADVNNYIRAVFSIDFTLYVIIGFVVVLFDYNKREMLLGQEESRIIEAFKDFHIGVFQLNFRGDIIGANNLVKKWLLDSDLDAENEVITIHQLVRFPMNEDFERIKEILLEGHTYSIESDDSFVGNNMRNEFLFLPNQSELYDNTHSIVVNCLVLDSNRELSVIHRLDDELEEIHTIPNRYKLMELFEQGIHQKRMYHFGVVLVKVVNFDALTNIVNAHEKSAIDYLVTEKLKKLEFIYCVGKVTQDTYEIITQDYGDNSEIVEHIQLIKDILMHQSFYDNEMNVYSLDYRIGVALAPEDGFTQRELLRNASIAIAKATTEKHGYVQFYHEEIKHEVANKLRIETKLRDSIFTNQLFLEYQPQYCVVSDKIRGFETLVRWRLQDGTIMSPNEFIPIAEESNLMDDLGEWVFRNSLEQAAIWNNEYHMEWTLSVNVSVVQLEQEGFAFSILELLKEFDYNPELLEIEVTETKMAKSSDRVFIELRKLQEYGIKIAIDDFGTGYSSLDFLRLMPFDIIKIDKGFIERLNDNDIDHKIIESIINLVKNIKVHSIAEGVETAEQLNFLKKANVDYVQGYVYNRPMAAEKVIDLIKTILFDEGVLMDEDVYEDFDVNLDKDFEEEITLTHID